MENEFKVRYKNAGFLSSRGVVQFVTRAAQMKKTYGYVNGEMTWMLSKGERAIIQLSVGLVGFVVALTLLTILWRGCKGGH